MRRRRRHGGGGTWRLGCEKKRRTCRQRERHGKCKEGLGIHVHTHKGGDEVRGRDQEGPRWHFVKGEEGSKAEEGRQGDGCNSVLMAMPKAKQSAVVDRTTMSGGVYVDVASKAVIRRRHQQGSVGYERSEQPAGCRSTITGLSSTTPNSYFFQLFYISCTIPSKTQTGQQIGAISFTDKRNNGRRALP